MSGFFDDALNRGEIAPAENIAAAKRRAEIQGRPPSLCEVLDEVCHEVERAERKHKPMNSAHEGYAVILEELDELKAEVWKGGSTPRDPIAMRKEAIEVAAMAVRFVRDVCDGRNQS